MEKFGHERRVDGAEPGLGPDYEVEHYLHHQGASFLSRFDALSYLYLTRTMDYFAPFEEEGIDAKLAGNPTKVLAISFSSDWRFDAGHSGFIVDRLKAAGWDAEQVDVESPWGHDSFLLDVPEYHELVAETLVSGELPG